MFRYQNKKIKIAVIGEQDIKGSIFNPAEQKSFTSIVENALKSDISTTQKFILVERREISNALKQEALNMALESDKINTAAKKLGVEYIVYALIDDISSDKQGGVKVTVSYTVTSLLTNEIPLSHRSIQGEEGETARIALQKAITKSSRRFVNEQLLMFFAGSAEIIATDLKAGILINKGISDGFTMALDFEIYEEDEGAFGGFGVKTKKVLCLARPIQCEDGKSILMPGEYKSDLFKKNYWKSNPDLLKKIGNAKKFKVRTIPRREPTNFDPLK